MLPFNPPRALTEVFYVEDQDVNVQLMCALFERRPQVRLHVAVDVRSALALAPATRPSLLLLDLRLPDGHGSLLLEQLREFAHLRDVPAIAVTAEHGFDAAGTGFEEVWRKPINLPRVLERLDHWLSARNTAQIGQGGARPDRAAASAR